MNQDLFYDPNKMLSYNRILNFIIGARGIGKTYGIKKHLVKRFIRHGKQFIWVRRYKDELKSLPRWFNDIRGEFPGHELQVKGRQFFIDGKLAGWAINLSAWQSLKSDAYPDVETIAFDEFIREKDNSGYIPNEAQALLNVMDTVFRTREDVRCICMSNAVTIVNPYFLYFNIVPNINKRYNAYQSILVEIPDSKDFATERRKTKFGTLIDGTEYGEMSLDNNFINDSSTFIERRSKESKYVFTVVYNGMQMGVWVDVKLGLMFVDTDHDPSSIHRYAITGDDLNENTMLMKEWKQNYHLLKLTKAFKKGYLRFDSQVLRNVGYEMFKKMGVQ
ncbi:DNA encapsidation protein [Cytobacillus phage Bfsp1]|nr:DNA encapsidation protein [Cytobacillus phage Bfsp1]